jgi:hypothetical protein
MEPGSAGDRAAAIGKRRRKRRDERIEGFSNLLRERLPTDRN